MAPMTARGPGRQSEPMGPGRLRGNPMGMSVADAAAVLEGNPTQEELFTALVTLALSAPDQYDAALVRAAEILTAQSRSQVTEDQVRTVVDSLISPEQGAGALAGGPPPPPPAPVTEEALPSLRPPIGVFPGFTAQRPGFAGGISPQLGPGMVEVAPRYRAGDEDRWAAKSSLEIRRQQRELEKAGLLVPGSYTPGFWDQASQEAMFTAMGYANEAGTSWEQILEQLKALPRQVDRREFVAPPELKPDPATIDQTVKAAFRGRLGREPTTGELAEMGAYLTGQYGTAHDVTVAMARAEFDAETAGLDREEAILRRDEMLAEGSMPGEVAAAGIPATPGPGSFTDVDPLARFREEFDQRFGPELHFIDERADQVRNAQNVFASLRNMTALIG